MYARMHEMHEIHYEATLLRHRDKNIGGVAVVVYASVRQEPQEDAT